MIKYSILIVIILASLITGKTQTTGWTVWEDLYKDNNISVQIQFYVPATTTCQSNTGKKFRYKYRVKGNYRNYPYYLTWKLDYLDCKGDLYYQTYSLEIGKTTHEDIRDWITVDSHDYEFEAAGIETRHYEEIPSNTEKYDSGKKPNKTSSDPEGINGLKKVYMNQPLELNVRGGSLGVGADWIWYQDSCGGRKIGSGRTIRIAPADRVKIFVRAEGKYNRTRCLSATVDVDKSSLAASGIGGETKLCKGSSTTLSVQGGALGLGANWVWYEASCGGKRLGMGSTINVTPNQNTTYYVRAEGNLNTSNCTSVQVAVFGRSTDPSSILVSNTAVCEGNSITVRVNGGQLAGDAKWVWYEGSCGTYPIGTGESLSLSPQKSTTYYVKAEGACNTHSNCINQSVTVIPQLPALTRIVAPTQVYKGQKTTLEVPAWNGPSGSRIEWYEGDCARGKYIGRGPSITIQPRSTTTYYAKGKGSCGTTNCLQTTIIPLKRNLWSTQCSDQSIFHFGWRLGLDYRGFEAITQKWDPQNGFYTSSPHFIHGGGVNGELRFAPIFKDYFSLGFQVGGALGSTPFSLSSSGRTTNEGTLAETYFYTRWNYGAELAIGAKPIKLIATINRYQQSNDYSGVLNQGSFDESDITFTSTQRWETVGAGLRFGNYTKPEAKNFDLIYTLSKETDIAEIGAVLRDIPNAIHGLSLAYWKHNKLKISLDFRMFSADDFWTDFDLEQSTLQVSISFSPDKFY